MITNFTFCGNQCVAYDHNPYRNITLRKIADKHLELFGYALSIWDKKITGASHPIEDTLIAELAMQALKQQIEKDEMECISQLRVEAENLTKCYRNKMLIGLGN